MKLPTIFLLTLSILMSLAIEASQAAGKQRGKFSDNVEQSVHR